MLWDLIRDFFVHNVFGGFDSNGFEVVTKLSDEFEGGMIYYNVGSQYDGSTALMSLSDWLSTTATIISISLIVILCCLFVAKIIKLVGGLIR